MTDCLLKTTETCPENDVFYQYPNGFNGLMNLTSEYNAPVFIGFPHCYSCEGGAESMADYYAYYKNNTEW